MEKRKSFDSKLLIKLGFTLLAITAITALLLSGVNAMTLEKIAALKLQSRNEAMQLVLPGSTTLDNLTTTVGSSTVYTMEMPSGSTAYCVEVSPRGFGGPITMIVGIKIVDGTKTVTGVSITAMSETGGLGTKAKDPGFLSQFEGKATSSADEVDAITGATVTSKAVAVGVGTALDAVSIPVEGGTSN